MDETFLNELADSTLFLHIIAVREHFLASGTKLLDNTNACPA